MNSANPMRNNLAKIMAIVEWSVFGELERLSDQKATNP
jgi:hypothetical protein